MQVFSQLKVIDFSSLLPGPMASLYLADWGADVLRIEAPDRDDLSRQVPPFDHGVSTMHSFLNRSKRSVVLDAKKEADRAEILRLIAEADILIEQFRPGVMARMGLDYQTLQQLNPRLLYCSISGYGQDGPYASRAGHDINYAALSGLGIMTGKKETGPVLHGAPVCDLAGSYHALFGILTALYHREQTGKGQWIDCSLTDSSLMLSSLWMQMQLAAQQSPQWESTLLNGASFYDYYVCQDGLYLSVGSIEPKFLQGFLEAIGLLSKLKGPWQSPEGMADLKNAIAAKLKEKPREEWLRLLQPLDVCVEPVLSFVEISKHPQFQARQMFVDVPRGDGSFQKQLASPIKFSALSPSYRWIGCEKGKHQPQWQESRTSGM